jgi:hypothetical protein
VQGTTGGKTYQFQISATNVYGEGERSPVLSQIASDVPDLINIASTRNSGTNIIVAWDAPFNNYQPILKYDIIFLASNGLYVRSNDCTGADPIVTECTIDMFAFVSLTGLKRGDLVVVRVRAENINGWHAFSQQNV